MLKHQNNPLLTIRKATDADWADLAQRAELTLSRDEGLVAELHGEIVAYLQWHPGGEAEQCDVYIISRLEVLKGFRERGYGRQLMAYAQAQSAIHTLIAEKVAWDAVPFVEKQGFVSDGSLNVDDDFDDAGVYVWHRPAQEGPGKP